MIKYLQPCYFLSIAQVSSFKLLTASGMPTQEVSPCARGWQRDPCAPWGHPTGSRLCHAVPRGLPISLGQHWQRDPSRATESCVYEAAP
jgi:hypothetical protein